MKLESLPRSNEAKLVKELDVVQALEWVKLLLVDKRDKNQEVELALVLGSKVDKLLFIEEFLKEDLITLALRQSLQQLTLGLEKFFQDGDVVTPEVLKERGLLKNNLTV